MTRWESLLYGLRIKKCVIYEHKTGMKIHLHGRRKGTCWIETPHGGIHQIDGPERVERVLLAKSWEEAVAICREP